MKTKFPSYLLFAALSLFAALATAGPRVAHAEQILTGKIYEKIDGTNPLAPIFLPGIGFSSSPTPTGNEVGDAFSEFSDPRAAMIQIEALKKKEGFKGGTVFVSFGYNGDRGSDLEAICGVSASTSGDLDELREHTNLFGAVIPTMPFSQFKLASRAERVRAIASCLAGLPGMPILRPSHNEIKKVYIDEESYRMAEAWLKSLDPEAVQGSSAQYRQMFLCLVSSAARSEKDATGESVVFRTLHQKDVRELDTELPEWAKGLFPKGTKGAPDEEEFTTLTTVMSVLNDSAAHKIWDAKRVEQMAGLWPMESGMAGMTIFGTKNPLLQALGPNAKKWLPECHREAGLFELPPARLPETSPSNCPH